MVSCVDGLDGSAIKYNRLDDMRVHLDEASPSNPRRLAESSKDDMKDYCCSTVASEPEVVVDVADSDTKVGAIRRLFSRCPSSDTSDALLTRLTCVACTGAVCTPLPRNPGVCGGVKSGMFDGVDPAAAMDGKLLTCGVGLFMTGGAF